MAPGGRELDCETAPGRGAAADGIQPTLSQRGITGETVSANESHVPVVDDYEPLRYLKAHYLLQALPGFSSRHRERGAPVHRGQASAPCSA